MIELHKLQASVLRELSRHQSRRFSEMMAVTGLTSADFKFHLRNLVKLSLIFKNEEGSYELTPEGKELANRFDFKSLSTIRQPKLTTVTYLRRHNSDTNQTEYYFQQRLRQPFFNYWGVIGEPVRWGEDFKHAASRGLMEKTGLSESLKFCGVYRQRDQIEGSNDVLEDKLFIIFAANWEGSPLTDWPYANSRWMTTDEFGLQPHHFESCLEMIGLIDGDHTALGDGATSYPADVY